MRRRRRSCRPPRSFRSAAAGPTAQCQFSPTCHFRMSARRIARPLPHWLTLTARITGRSRCRKARLDDPQDLRLDRAQVAAERVEEGHDHRTVPERRQRDGLPVLIAEREARERGARPAAQLTTGGAGCCVADARSGPRNSTIRTPMPTPTTATAARNSQRRCPCVRIQPARNSLCSARERLPISIGNAV